MECVVVKPVFVLAGQSNAQAIQSSVNVQLENVYGKGGYELVHVHAPGAPLTYQRNGLDWLNASELRDTLVESTSAALLGTEDAVFAGVLWFQGEADTHLVGRPDEYQARLETLATETWDGLAEKLGADASILQVAKFSVTTLSQLAPDAPDRAHWQEITAAQKAAASANDLITVLDIDAVFSDAKIEAPFKDGLHYAEAAKAVIATAAVERLTDASSLEQRLDDVEQITRGNAEDDIIIGGKADEIISGGHGADQLHGRAGDDMLKGGADADLLFGGGENDTVIGGSGNDVIKGGGQSDLLKGAKGADELRGGNGDDTILGGADNDHASAGRGDDVINGGRGDDVLFGGEGADVFVFSGRVDHDVIRDFSQSDGDQIDLSSFQSIASFEDVRAHLGSSDKGHALISVGSDHSIELLRLSASDMSADDFIF